MAVEDFGETIVTEQNVADWVALVKAARRATHAYKPQPGRVDRSRPVFGTNVASSESGEE